MTKVKNITVTNYKAISEEEIDLNGCSAIITAGNDKGKTSLLRGMADRFKGLKADEIVHHGETKGVYNMELTDGSKIQWKFTEKSESFKFTTKDDIVQTTGVLSSIGKMYFGDRFDIDKFISKSNKEQTKEVQKLVGIDLDELDKKYKVAYELRSDANKELKRIKALNIKEPLEVDEPDIDSIKKEKIVIQQSNQNLKSKWIGDNEKHQQEALNFNKKQDLIKKTKDDFKLDLDSIQSYSDNEVANFIDYEGMNKFYETLPDPEEKKEVTTLVEPDYNDLLDIDKRLEYAYADKTEYDGYVGALNNYKQWVKDEENAINKVAELNAKLETIQSEKLEKIKESKLPEDFEITDEGILYKGFSLNDTQISSSAKYIASLKLGSLVLGRIRTMHFDASYLDNISLGKIQDWADENNLQLLIERPALDGGDIVYNIIEELS